MNTANLFSTASKWCLIAGCAALCGAAFAQDLDEVPLVVPQNEAPSDDSLAQAIAVAYATNPALAAQRYDLRATDDDVGVAMSQTRPQAQVQIAGAYDLTLPGSITQAARPISDRLNDPNIERDELTSQLVVDQPVWTGGRARSALALALASGDAGRQSLRGAEGDLLLELIAAYSDVVRDTRAKVIRSQNLSILEQTLDEVMARREAGELTRTDVAQAEAQLEAARVQLTAADAQLEASRATFATIVGRPPGNLSVPPHLPALPKTPEEAFELAELGNPDLAEALAAEKISRARIATARAEGRPDFLLRGTAGTRGPASPLDSSEHDVIFTGRATLSIPLSAGGRVRSQVAQARNRQTADALRVEATRRQMARAIANAWNQWSASARSLKAQEAQLAAAQIYYEGTFAEYREGLRSTFDVLFAQNSLRETEVALLATQRDLYVAQAALLRQMGQLEARALVRDPRLYDPDAYLKRVAQRNAVPWSGLVRAIDGIGAPDGTVQTISVDRLGSDEPQSIPVPPNSANPPNDLIRGEPIEGSNKAPTPNANTSR